MRSFGTHAFIDVTFDVSGLRTSILSQSAYSTDLASHSTAKKATHYGRNRHPANRLGALSLVESSPEPVAGFGLEQVAGLDWNRWRVSVDYAAKEKTPICQSDTSVFGGYQVAAAKLSSGGKSTTFWVALAFFSAALSAAFLALVASAAC